MKWILVFLVILLACERTLSQDQDTLRDKYVQRFPDYFFLWPVIKQKQLTFGVRQLDGGKSLDYEPNNAFTFGFGAYVFDIALEFTFAIPPDNQSEIQFGKSEARDFQINALTRKWGIDFFKQKYSGYYIDDPGYSLGHGGIYPQRSDIVAKNFGITGLYIFSDRKYSIKSSFNFSERQIESGGSFLLTGTVGSFRVSGDSAIVNPDYQERFGNGAGFMKLRNTTLSVAPGYAYNLILKERFFLSGALMIGPAHNWILYQSEGSSEKNDIKINVFTSFRMGLGYNGERFFGGINFLAQSRSVRFEDLRVVSSSSTVRLLVGYRFKEFGVLKKSIWDIPKEISMGVSNN